MPQSESIKSPVRPVHRTALTRVLERQAAQRAELFRDPLLDLKTVQAALGGVSYSYVRRALASGKLKSFRIGRGHRKVRQSAVLAFLAEGDRPEVRP